MQSCIRIVSLFFEHAQLAHTEWVTKQDHFYRAAWNADAVLR